MARSLLVTLAALACAAFLAIPVLAAEPAEGELSAEKPSVKWTGEPLSDYLEVTTEQGNCDDEPPICDTFTMTVKDPGTKLTVDVKSDNGDDWVSVEIVPPTGDPVFKYERKPAVSASIANPPVGEYLVHVMGSAAVPFSPTVPYTATATLTVPEPEPAATPEPLPPPIVTIDPTPTPEPPPPAPAQPAQAGPRTLSLHADRRKIKRAVKFGMRVRTRCEGGCSTIKLRGYVSGLTASQLRLGSYRNEAEVATAPLVHNAEGRRVTMISFKKSMRKRLARARRLPIAIEVVATDPDGVARTFVKRFTLRR